MRMRVLLLFLLSIASAMTFAQDYPTKPVHTCDFTPVVADDSRVLSDNLSNTLPFSVNVMALTRRPVR